MRAYSNKGRNANPRPVASECVCYWLGDANGLDCGDRSWICNAPKVHHCEAHNRNLYVVCMRCVVICLVVVCFCELYIFFKNLNQFQAAVFCLQRMCVYYFTCTHCPLPSKYGCLGHWTNRVTYFLHITDFFMYCLCLQSSYSMLC